MPQFMLLLNEQPADFAGLSPAEMQGIIAEYSAWREQIARRGRLAGGNKLKDEGGRIMRVRSGRLEVSDGPFSEAKEVLGGYFLIEAGDYDEALAIARDCPHLKYGGSIHLREIDPIHD